MAARTGRVLAVAGMTALAAVFGAGQAQAAPTSTIVYSTDGGSTWSNTITAPPGATIMVRLFYNNDTNDAMGGTSVTTSIPDGFTPVPGSTTACLNPGTVDPTAPTGEQVCSSTLTDAAIWAGSDLTVSPTAGLFGQPTTDTVGIMAMGKTRYVNLNQCDYNNSGSGDNATTVLSTGTNFDAGTNVSNTAQTTETCDAGNAAAPNHAGLSDVAALDLLGNRYLNLHQCDYNNPASGDNLTTYVNAGTNFDSGTNTSNTADATEICDAGNSIAPNHAGLSTVAAFDMLNNRYLNIHQCNYNNAGSGDNLMTLLPTGTLWDAGTNASDTADTTLSCDTGNPAAPFHAGLSTFLPLDTLDTTRGQGYIQFSMVAPSPTTTTTYPETVQLTGPGTGDPTGTGSITIDPAAVPLVDPAVAAGALLFAAATGAVIVRRRGRQLAV